MKTRAQRFTVSVDVALAAEEVHYVLEAGNLSETGLFIHKRRAFPVGTRLRMVFGRPPDLPRVHAEGVVRWSESGKGVGVEFTSLSPEDKQALLEFLSSRP